MLEPYLKDTDLGLPYWDWTKNATIPDLWEDVFSPIKEFNHTDFDGPLRFTNLSRCHSQFPGNFLKMIFFNILLWKKHVLTAIQRGSINDILFVSANLLSPIWNFIFTIFSICSFIFLFYVQFFVFCYQNCSDLLWEKTVLVIEKNFWNSRLKAQNLQNFWDH